MVEQRNSEQKRINTSFINDFLQKYALMIIILLAACIIVFGLIIRTQAQAAINTSQNYPYPVDPTPSPSLDISESTPTPTPLKLPVIVIDPGHGGKFSGSEGSNGKALEKTINLSLSLILHEMLESNGYTVYMTRFDDTAASDDRDEDLHIRGEFAVDVDADIFISIHQNAFPEDGNVHGPEVYYHTDNHIDETLVLAQSIQDALDDVAGMTKSRGIRSFNHTVTGYIPLSVLVECGYLTNPEEEEKLQTQEYQKEVAGALYEALVRFIGSRVW